MNSEIKVPKSVGFIMDGNRRWAREKGLPTMKGHELGYKKIIDVLNWCKEAGVGTVYLYAFSTENWNRSKEEVAYLMKLFLKAFGQDAKKLIDQKFQVKFAGQIERFSKPLQAAMRKLEKATEHYKSGNFVICLSYGGRAEILAAAKKMAHEKTMEEIDKMTEEEFSRFLWTASLPDPELVVRTSGELRTSNFLPWQTAYSEWFFPKTYWPAFSKEEFHEILKEFARREIRRGK